MKRINVAITRLQQTEIEVPDDFELDGEDWPRFSTDQMLQLQSARDRDTTTVGIHAELVEPVSGSYRATFLIEGVTFDQACIVASERLGPDEDYGFDYTITDEGITPA